ncbi:hypothetical protein C1645_817683 [Glomus cerebriforme]|uniref:Uncharacterized protein n=1 Tax=Glomus cerebriforme TaxID=658196 RepID=A0A397TDU2_9GLOM|nr:hypothetical protein C1645_817683 [Glomus cerebriforme]
MLSNSSFSFLVDSSLVRALGIRKLFSSENSESEKKHLTLGIQNRERNVIYFCELELETFSSRNSESEKKHSALEMETEM